MCLLPTSQFFASNLPVVQDEGNVMARSAKPMQANLDQIIHKMTIMEEIGRDIVVLLKCVMCACVFFAFGTLWGLRKNA